MTNNSTNRVYYPSVSIIYLWLMWFGWGLKMWLLWLNTLISIIGVFLGIFLASGSVISIANMQVSWAWLLLVAAFAVPVMFGISGIGAWLAYAFGGLSWVNYFIALPWVYLALFIAAMLLTFKSLA